VAIFLQKFGGRKNVEAGNSPTVVRFKVRDGRGDGKEAQVAQFAAGKLVDGRPSPTMTV
jgi:hypothetical protein